MIARHDDDARRAVDEVLAASASAAADGPGLVAALLDAVDAAADAAAQAAGLPAHAAGAAAAARIATAKRVVDARAALPGGVERLLRQRLLYACDDAVAYPLHYPQLQWHSPAHQRAWARHRAQALPQAASAETAAAAAVGAVLPTAPAVAGQGSAASAGSALV